MIATATAVETGWRGDAEGQADQEPAPARQRKPWKPSGRDELVYQWVRMEGKTQQWVASAMDISQATVSRTLARYGKWQAHAKPGADGSLDRAERQRMQWQLTYERNERIVASALRLADEMEFPRDMEKSVTVRPNLPTTDERMIRQESFVQDRSGMIARFLRLAFRVNMEQLKLVDHEPEPLAPLTEEEEAACAAGSAAVEAEVAACDQRRAEDEELRRRMDNDVQQIVAAEVERRLAAWEEERKAAGFVEAGSSHIAATSGRVLPGPGLVAPAIEDEDEQASATPGPGLVPAEDATPGPDLVPAEDVDKTPCLKLHKVHNAGAAEIDASSSAEGACDSAAGPAKHVREVHRFDSPSTPAPTGAAPPRPGARAATRARRKQGSSPT